MEHPDIETAIGDSHLYNRAVSSFSWKDVNVSATPRGETIPLLQNCAGSARAGELLAVMGPSGCGKTTLLNFLSGRLASGSKLRVKGQRLMDGVSPSQSDLRALGAYVEQEDALIGSLTARETIDFAARLAPRRVSSSQARRQLVTNLLSSFGLMQRQDVLVGTPLRKGLSGGQKRRVSVASQLVTGPAVLWLDEPTSGLDSTASYEIMSFVRSFAKKYNLVVICSIHQPSTSTFNLFDQICLLAEGQTAYFGPVNKLEEYLSNIGHPLPLHINPAEFLLDLVNADFGSSGSMSLSAVLEGWERSSARRVHLSNVNHHRRPMPRSLYDAGRMSERLGSRSLLVLLYRSFIKSYRDVVVYGVRLAMYFGLAVMMGTVWLRLDSHQDSIQPFINALFFGGAFLSFMAVAYVPAYLEDYSVYKKDYANGLYGPAQFLLCNFLIGIPYLFLIVLLFSIIVYWLSGFRNDGEAFFTWVLWLFLDLLAAESLVVLLASIFPIFVISLALVAFSNGLWMSVGGFLVPLPELNAFWKYTFHYIDYQAYVFQGMMVNEFKDRVYDCDSDCQCSYPVGELECRIPGTSVLERYGYALDERGQWLVIMLAITIVYRLLAYLVMSSKRW